MPGTLYMPVSAPVEAVRPRTDSMSESPVVKTDSDNPGFDKILESKAKEVISKPGKVEDQSSEKSRRPRTRSINGQVHSEPDVKLSAMENTLTKVFGENRDLTVQTSSESGQLTNGIQPESSGDGNGVIVNPITVDTHIQNSGTGIISNFNGIPRSNENVVNSIGPPGRGNSPPQDSLRIETAGPRGKDQNPQPEKARFTEEAEASKAQRGVSVKTTPVFDWIRRNFKAPAGEITRGDTDRLTKPAMPDIKPVVTVSSNDSKQSLSNELPNDQPALKVNIASNVQPSLDFSSEVKPVMDMNRIVQDQSPEMVSQNVKPAETVSRNAEQPSVYVLNDSKPEVEKTIQGDFTRSADPISNDAALNRESMRSEAGKDAKVVLQDVKSGNENSRFETDKFPMNVQQEIKSSLEPPKVTPLEIKSSDAVPKVVLQDVKSTETAHTGQQEIKSESEVSRVETERSSKPPVQNEPSPKQDVSSGEVAKNSATSKNPDSANASSESASTSNSEQKVLNTETKVVDSIPQKGITPQSENPTSTAPSISNAGNQSAIPVSTPVASQVNIKVDEPISVLGNAPVRIAAEIKESATEELPIGGKAVLRIELSPPRLGRMNIELVKTEDGIDVKLMVRTAFAKDLLLQRGEEIKTALHDQGIDIRRFSIVETGSSRDNAHQNMSGFESSTSSHQNDGNFRESQEPGENSPLVPTDESEEDSSAIDSEHNASNRNNSGGLNILA